MPKKSPEETNQKKYKEDKNVKINLTDKNSIPNSKIGSRESIKKDFFYKFFTLNPFFRNIDKKNLMILSELSKIKNVRSNVKIVLNEINDKKYRFLTNNYCLVKEGFVFLIVENNYKKTVVDIFFPLEIISMNLISLFGEASPRVGEASLRVGDGKIFIPRNSSLLLIPFDPRINDIMENYKNETLLMKIKYFYLDLINYKGLDSINRLLYFLHQYLKRNVLALNNDQLLLSNKKLISYITGNSHEVIVRNFKKLQKMGYLIKQGKNIKINKQKVEEWAKKLKIIS